MKTLEACAWDILLYSELNIFNILKNVDTFLRAIIRIKMVYRCNLCIGYLSVSLRELLHHMRRTHSSDPNFHMVCGLEGCPRTYKRFSSFRNHVMRKHSLMYNGKDEIPMKRMKTTKIFMMS